jgi:putative NIF3 family GTP cyclohydrolase 1 type 2
MINAITSAGGLALLGLQIPSGTAPNKPGDNVFTVQDIIDTILKEGGLSPKDGTVDTIKAGRADQKVTGIVTTMFATITVIEEAAKRNANFIIAHEPTFYNHRDDMSWVKDSVVIMQKKELIEKHGLAIWRFHDYCHSLKPDGITYGVCKKADWLPYFKTGEKVLIIPPLSLQQLVQHLKSSLGIAHVKVIGSLEQRCERVALLPGAWGGQLQVSTVEAEHPDVLIVGEVSEWETAEYIRDARLLGKQTALIILGHAMSEDPGMEWLVDWLQPKLPGVPVSHVPSGDPFLWI